jgi:hypothetical protein
VLIAEGLGVRETTCFLCAAFVFAFAPATAPRMLEISDFLVLRVGIAFAGLKGESFFQGVPAGTFQLPLYPTGTGAYAGEGYLRAFDFFFGFGSSGTGGVGCFAIFTP